MASLLTATRSHKPRPKVIAATVGAGVGAGLGAYSGIDAAPDLAALVIDLAGLQLSESGARGLAKAIAMLIVIITAAVGSFGSGYMKREYP